LFLNSNEKLKKGIDIKLGKPFSKDILYFRLEIINISRLSIYDTAGDFAL